MKHPTDKIYNGVLSKGQRYTHKDGSTALVDEIAKKDNVWSVTLEYQYPAKKKYQLFTIPCYDFEKMIRDKEWMC